MSHDFVSQIEKISHCRRRGSVICASCWAVVVILLAAAGLMFIDWLSMAYSATARWLLTLGFISVCSWVFRRWWKEVSTSWVSPLQIALEVEQEYPQLKELVSSAFDFARQEDDDPVAGSPSLRRAVVLQARAAADQIDWQPFVARQPLFKAIVGLAILVLTLGLTEWATPSALTIGASRLINPLSDVQWPRTHDLQFIDVPTSLAAGSDLELVLEDSKGSLPSSITIHFRTRQKGRWNEQERDFQTAGKSFTWQRPNLQQTLQIRATGGDHISMPWHTIEVVPPPLLQSLEIVVHPPSYTQLPQVVWLPGTAVYAGSWLQLQGKLDQSVQQLRLTNSSNETLEVDLGSNGRAFNTPADLWKVNTSESWSLVAVTSSGASSRVGEKFLIEVLIDQSPEVHFLQPAVDLFVVPSADLELQLEASDDLGLRSLDLTFSPKVQLEPQILSLWTSETNAEDTKKILISHRWQLSDLSLSPGDTLVYAARAADSQSVYGKAARSWKLHIVSEEDLWNQLLEDQRRVTEQLVELISQQREVRVEVDRWQDLPEWSLARWTNAGHSALYRQRQIAELLGEGSQSVLSQLHLMLQAIERNRLARPAIAERLQLVHQLLQDLVAGKLTRLEESLTELVHQAQRNTMTVEQLPEIERILEHQEEVLATLRRANNLLLPGNMIAKLQQQLALLKSDQVALTAECREQLPALILPGANSSERSIQFSQASRQQNELATRFADWLLDLATAMERLIDNQPTLAARIASTQTLAQQLEVHIQLQQAAEELARSRYGRTSTLQSRIIEDLARLQLRLAGQDQQDSSDRLDQLRSAERELQRLRHEVAKLEEQLKQLSSEAPNRELQRLKRQREDLAAMTEQISRQLDRLKLPQASRSLSQATQQLRQPALTEQTTHQARQRLDEAQRQLSTERRRQQVALARLEMARLSTRLERLVKQQLTLHEELMRLNSLRQKSAQLTPAQQEAVAQLADGQADLRAEVSELAAQLTTLPVFKLLLSQTAKRLQRLEDQLRAADLGETSVLLSTEIVQRLQQLAEALQKQQQELEPEKQSGSQNGGQRSNGGDKPQAEALQLALGQLQLLKALQLELRGQTESLVEQHVDGPLRQKALQLAEQQQELSEMARELIPEPEDPELELPIEEFDLDRELQESLEP